MAEQKYLIVGTEVGNQTRILHKNGTIDDQADPEGTPLNVEFIGRLMVELSKKGRSAFTKDQLAERAEQVKNALTVQDFPGQSGLVSAEQRRKILDNTTVEIVFETRKRQAGKPDKNKRILVIPCDETLEVTDTTLQQHGQATGFRPPLSYELDKALMLSSLKKEIMGMVQGFSANPPAGWTPELQDALETHMEAALKARTAFVDRTGALVADDVRNQILSSPLRSFHRSVGIYATNMCR